MTGLSLSVSGANGDFAITASFHTGSGITALFGRSGAGKSTLLKMIAGTLQPDEGHISIGDLVLFDKARGINLAPEQRRIGFVFQDARLFPHLSVKRNLTYARWAGGRKAVRAFDEVTDLLGIADLLDRAPATLSGGERQRVAIGRALLSDPALLLLDEPLSSLDHARRQEILPFIERLRDESHLPIIYVSHEVDEVARLADDIVVLEAGKVQATGPALQVFPLIEAQSEAAGVLLQGQVLAYDRYYGLADIDLNGALFQLADMPLQAGSSIRLRIRSRDVSIATQPPAGISIRNILPVTIIDMAGDSDAHMRLVLDFNGQHIAARLTRRSVEELGLQAEQRVYALIKAVSVDRTATRRN